MEDGIGQAMMELKQRGVLKADRIDFRKGSQDAVY